MSLFLIVPFLSALFYGVGSIFQKSMLRKRNMDIKLYQVTVFFAIAIVLIPFLFLIGGLDPKALSLWSIVIMFSIVVLALLANYFQFTAIKKEPLTNLEPAMMIEPLLIVVVAVILSFFFPEDFERNLNIVIPALIASAALIFSHVRKHHLVFNKYFIAVIIASFLFATEVTLSRLILDFYKPVTFYFVRCLLVGIVSLAIFKPHFRKLDGKLSWELLGLGLIFVIYRILMYYGFIYLGVIFTTLVIMVGPIFVYALAWKFLHEKLDWKNIVAAIVILACVGYVLVF